MVFLVKENHTFDSYFGTFPGADGVSAGITSGGNSVPLVPTPDSGAFNPCHSWDCSILAMGGGLMNNFDLTNGGGFGSYTQVTDQEIPNYWAYAGYFALADRFFTSIHGPTLPNYLYMVAAQSGGLIDNGQASLGKHAMERRSATLG